MDSPENGCSSYEKDINSINVKPTLVDASVQLNLEDCSSETDVETVQTFPECFSDFEMKLPLTVQNCLPLNAMQMSSDLVVITNTGLNFLNEQKVPLTPLQAIETGEPLRKRICIEQNGQTYIFALQDGLDGLASLVELANKGQSAIEPQVLTSQETGANPAKNGINQNWFTSKAEKTTLQNEGHVWKQGMWSKEEIELLESNIQQYCEEHEVSDPATIIFQWSKDERKDFYRTIAKGLNRPLFSVYRRVIRMYDNTNHVGKYTTEELDKLRDLRALHGNDWQSIGTAMGRSASSIKDRCRLMRDNCNQGKWHPSEEKRLAESVYELTNCLPGEMISSGLSWAIVAEKVKTRSEKQCRTKWLNYLNWKEAGGTEWTKDDDIALICRVCSFNATDENHVDWSELSKGWLSVRSPQWLRGKWWNLKRHVPDNHTIPFPDVCEYLYQHFILRNNPGDDAPTQNISEENVIISSAHIISHSKPAIIQSVLPATPPAGIVVTSVSQACHTPVVSLPGSSTIGLENVFPSLQVGPVLQTLEVLPSNIQLSNPQAFITTSHSQQGIPLASALPANKIIIHTLPAESLQASENIPVQIDHPIIINTTNPMTSLASTQIPSAPPSPEMADHAVIGETDSLIQSGHQYDCELQVVEGDIEREEHITLCENNSPHIILADPMLAGGQNLNLSAQRFVIKSEENH